MNEDYARALDYAKIYQEREVAKTAPVWCKALNFLKLRNYKCVDSEEYFYYPWLYDVAGYSCSKTGKSFLKILKKEYLPISDKMKKRFEVLAFSKTHVKHTASTFQHIADQHFEGIR